MLDFQIKVYIIVSYFFQEISSSISTMVKLKNDEQLFGHDKFIESFLKNEAANCILYSKEGVKFNVHREILYQTKLMQNIFQSCYCACCPYIEIFCPCSETELDSILNFLYNGKTIFDKENKVIHTKSNLVKIFGFPENLFSIEDCSMLYDHEMVENNERFEYSDTNCDNVSNGINQEMANTSRLDIIEEMNLETSDHEHDSNILQFDDESTINSEPIVNSECIQNLIEPIEKSFTSKNFHGKKSKQDQTKLVKFDKKMYSRAYNDFRKLKSKEENLDHKILSAEIMKLKMNLNEMTEEEQRKNDCNSEKYFDEVFSII